MRTRALQKNGFAFLMLGIKSAFNKGASKVILALKFLKVHITKKSE